MSAPPFASLDLALCPACAALVAEHGPGALPARCEACDEASGTPETPRVSEAPASPQRRAAPLRPIRGPRLVVCLGELAEAPASTALDRAAREAARPAAEDSELVRVRAFVFALRPDAPDPMGPPPVEQSPAAAPYCRTESAPPWDRLPRGLGSTSLGIESDPRIERRGHVLGAIASLPPDAAAVCRWLRASATFAQGLRGLYVDVGIAFASDEQREAWQNLTARRTGAHAHGRALVLAAERAWREAA